MHRELLQAAAAIAAAFFVVTPTTLADGHRARDWTAAAPGFRYVEVRDVALAPDGMYVAANVAMDKDPVIPLVAMPTEVYVGRVNAAGEELWSATIDGDGQDVVRAIAVDQAGFVYLGGSTLSGDFPVVGVPAPVTVSGRRGFLWKADPATGEVVYSLPFGNALLGQGGLIETEVVDIAVDADGAAWVTGWTTNPRLPTTDDALQPTWEGVAGGFFQPAIASFLMKVRPDGQIAYATYLAGSERSEGSVFAAVTEGLAVALGPGGSVYVAGHTNTIDFPVTEGAYQTSCDCPQNVGDAFVARFAGDGTLDYATYLGGTAAEGFVQFGRDSANALAVDAAGAAYVGGSTHGPNFPTTPGAFQTAFHDDLSNGSSGPVGDGFLVKLSPDGSTLEYATFLGEVGADRVAGVAVRDDGSAVVAGFSAIADELAAGEGFLASGAGYVATVLPDGSGLASLTRVAGGARSPSGAFAFSADTGQVAFSTDPGVVVRLDALTEPEPGVWALTGAPELGLARFVAPGELVSLYGVGIGPAEPASFALDANGRVPTELGGVRVEIDGTPAPILYAARGQVNVIAPFGTATEGRVQVRLWRDGEAMPAVMTAVAEAAPGVFPAGDGWAYLNPDGTLNHGENPAAKGDVVAVWVSGVGALSPQPADGSVAEAPFSMIEQDVTVYIGDEPAEIVYAGAAPGLGNGVAQINFRVPEAVVSPVSFLLGFGVVPVVVEVGGTRSELTFLSIQTTAP